MIAFSGERLRGVLLLAGLIGFASWGFVASALAFTEPGFTGQFSDFANCPAKLIQSASSGKCIHSITTGGSVQIGHSTVPISVPGDTFDLGETGEKASEGVNTPVLCAPVGSAPCAVSPPHGILNGPAQPVPAGLLGTVGNVQLTNVSAKLEWATAVPPNTGFGRTGGCIPDPLLTFSLCWATGGQGTVATLKAKIHLLSPFLGSNCYIGSAAHPIVISLTTGFTNPPFPAHPIHGNPYEAILAYQGGTQTIGTVLVNNSFSVPAASGCGTSTGGLLDASINRKLGLPSLSGQNSIVIKANSEALSAAIAVAHGVTGE